MALMHFYSRLASIPGGSALEWALHVCMFWGVAVDFGNN